MSWPQGKPAVNNLHFYPQVTFSEEVETRRVDYPAGDQNETILQELRERDSQVRELLEAKYFYEEVLSELCEEAGLFELDQNEII